MKTKRLLTFILLAFLPMVAVGLTMHFSGASSVGLPEDPSAIDPLAAVKGLVFSAGAMLIPLLAVLFTQLIFKEPVLKGLGVSFRINRWWWTGWLLMPLIAFATLGVTLLMPGARWTPEGEMVQSALRSMPEGTGLWGGLAVVVISGMLNGLTVNAVFAFGEEIAWRGFLMKEFKGKKFLAAALWIGVIWGLWHAPLILNGHNYPQHPVAGVFMMVVFCLLLTPILMYFRQKSGSVIVPAILHGTFNAVAGISAMVVTPANDLLYGGAGLSGFIVLLMTDVCLYLYDRFVSKEMVFASVL